ncbi:MAG: hypothetical protein ACK49D_09515 [Flavobacteriia bacterium]|jgi:hypothetical protein|nr:hypothetical protein [Cryomorphaceae bacterium]
MAGGKETPRQKMIGMMYLVLTALLALNVSKSILDAFVAIEENIQISNENEYQRGFEKKSDLEATAQDKSVPEAQKKAMHYLKIVEDIDKMTAERIKLIDDIKIEILKACGEDVTSIGGPESIIFKAYSKADPLRPTRMHLEHVAGKDKYDEAMAIMIGEDIKNPSANGQGMKLWKSYNDYRAELTEKIASSWMAEKGKKKYSFKAPAINAFKDFKDLNAQIDKSMKNVNPEDKESIKKIYASLTKLEKSKVHEIDGVHWIGKTFDHSPSVAAIASLSSMQKEILTARADAIALIRSRVGGGEYSFNKIMALAYGPEIANTGDEVTIEVLMAAYDSDRQPEVTFNGAKITEVKDGKGFVRTKATGGAEMVLKGTVSISNKFGVKKEEKWEKTIKIMKPAGNVSLPELNVLYIGYDNKVEGVASGYDQTVLSSSANVKLTKSGDLYIAKVSSGREATISVSGKSSTTNKTVNLKTQKFRVMRLPDPEIYWGAAKNGEKGSKAEPRLFVKYPPEIPLSANWKMINWEIQVPGAIGKPPTGTGNDISSVLGALKLVKPGNNISFICTVVGPDGIQRKRGATFKL